MTGETELNETPVEAAVADPGQREMPGGVVSESLEALDASREDIQISIRGLGKTYRTDDSETVAIEGFDLDVKKGELISIVGPSGCGKTTLLRMIAGLLEPTTGSIVIDGRVCEGPGPDRGMVFQDFALFPWRSVRRNIEFGLEIDGTPSADRAARSDELLSMVGLTDFADARVHELSGGMKQRVAIARALATNPDVLLMDEPFGALDAQTRNLMQENLVNILSQTDQTVIFITHSVDEAVYLSDRIVVLTKRPATIKSIFDIPWEWPRDRAAPEFTALRKEILEELREENVMN
ncbi:MAG: ABC transporter ATP-binding protein [Thermoplasmata archaeon]|nr:ABC transporter ATP-binding protein [Thermoplasmata archaeon]